MSGCTFPFSAGKLFQLLSPQLHIQVVILVLHLVLVGQQLIPFLTGVLAGQSAHFSLESLHSSTAASRQPGMAFTQEIKKKRKEL